MLDICTVVDDLRFLDGKEIVSDVVPNFGGRNHGRDPGTVKDWVLLELPVTVRNDITILGEIPVITVIFFPSIVSTRNRHATKKNRSL